MTIYYSVSTKGFYDTEVVSYPSLPKDIVEITKTEHELLVNAINNENKEIVLEGDNLVVKPRVPSFTWDIIRATRNRLLSQSDHTQVPDWPGDKEAWAVYRQELRDLPIKFKDPNKVVWPTPPNS